MPKENSASGRAMAFRINSYLLAVGATAAGGSLASKASATMVTMDLSSVPLADRTTTVDGSAIYIDLQATSPDGALSFVKSADADLELWTATEMITSGKLTYQDVRTRIANVSDTMQISNFGTGGTDFAPYYTPDGSTLRGNGGFLADPESEVTADLPPTTPPPTTQSYKWTDYTSAIVTSAVLYDMYTYNNPTADPANHTGYIGLRFLVNGVYDYGWIGVTEYYIGTEPLAIGTASYSSTFSIDSIGYNDTPGEAAPVPLAAVPEPSAAWMLASGAAGLLAWRRRKGLPWRATRVNREDQG